MSAITYKIIYSNNDNHKNGTLTLSDSKTGNGYAEFYTNVKKEKRKPSTYRMKEKRDNDMVAFVCKKKDDYEWIFNVVEKDKIEKYKDDGLFRSRAKELTKKDLKKYKVFVFFSVDNTVDNEDYIIGPEKGSGTATFP